VGTKQSVEMKNLHEKCFSPWEHLTFMAIDEPSGHQVLRTRRP
jgi:hypothetical protein